MELRYRDFTGRQIGQKTNWVKFMFCHSFFSFFKPKDKMKENMLQIQARWKCYSFYIGLSLV